MVPPFPCEFLTCRYDNVPTWPRYQVTQNSGLDINGFHGSDFRFLELMKERNGGPMIGLESPPMVILCVLMFKF
jgi:hypothetical protein